MRLGPRSVEQLKRQSAHGKDLIRSKRGVHFTRAMIHINHVVKTSPRLLIPKLVRKGFHVRAHKRRFQSGQNWPAILSALSHSACTLDWFAYARRDDPFADFASIQVSCTPRSPAASKPSLIHADAEARAFGVTIEDREDGLLEMRALVLRADDAAAVASCR
jgi:hypothetical protein